MPYCINCGNKLPTKAKFCPDCGEKISDSKDQEPTIQNDSYQVEIKSKQEDNSITKNPRKKPVSKKVIGEGTPQRESEISTKLDSEDSGCVGLLFSIFARLFLITIGITLFFTNPSEEDFKQYLLVSNGISESELSLANAFGGNLNMDLDRTNLLLLSIHKTEVSASFFGIIDSPTESKVFIGIFNHFFEWE